MECQWRWPSTARAHARGIEAASYLFVVLRRGRFWILCHGRCYETVRGLQWGQAAARHSALLSTGAGGGARAASAALASDCTLGAGRAVALEALSAASRSACTRPAVLRVGRGQPDDLARRWGQTSSAVARRRRARRRRLSSGARPVRCKRRAARM